MSECLYSLEKKCGKSRILKDFFYTWKNEGILMEFFLCFEEFFKTFFSNNFAFTSYISKYWTCEFFNAIFNDKKIKMLRKWKMFITIAIEFLFSTVANLFLMYLIPK